jgi:hypothetical protein
VSTAEQDKLLRVATQFPILFAEALFFGDEPVGRELPALQNGTASLIKIDGRYLAVTCKHVIDAYRERLERGGRTVFQIGELIIADAMSSIVGESESHDLASLSLDRYVNANLIERSKFFEPATWPPGEVEVGDFVAFAGFPGEWRKQPEIREADFGAFSSGGSEVHSLGDNYFYARIELDRCVHPLVPKFTMPSLGGLSGGPVFIWRQLHAELVGFIQEYQDQFDLLYVRKASVMLESGAFAS